MNPILNAEEKEIVEYIESGKAQSIANLSDEKNRFQDMDKAYSLKKKAINIRLPESDIYALKQKSLESGLSYQNIIQSLVHQYIQGRIKASF
jgi:predicted DNA binding CopG/RHH family protein